MSLSDKHDIYLYTYVIICKYLISVTYLMMCHGFWFWGYGLFTERVVAHPLYFFIFPPGVKVLANIAIVTTLYSST